MSFTKVSEEQITNWIKKEDLKSAPFFINYLSEEQKAKIAQDGIYISSDTAITKHVSKYGE